MDDAVGNKVEVGQGHGVVVDETPRERREQPETVVFKFPAKFLSPQEVEDDPAKGLDGVVGDELEQERISSESVDFQVADVARCRSTAFRRRSLERRVLLETRAVIFGAPRTRRRLRFLRNFRQAREFRFRFFDLADLASAQNRFRTRGNRLRNWRENLSGRSGSALKPVADAGKRGTADTDAVSGLESSVVDEKNDAFGMILLKFRRKKSVE